MLNKNNTALHVRYESVNSESPVIRGMVLHSHTSDFIAGALAGAIDSTGGKGAMVGARVLIY